ncbi:MAG: class I SAM-dependent methyltransferase [Trueperaceae bacterium]|nr:class I SAM-dependent methyltransferase [Trueperaceae bacterium]
MPSPNGVAPLPPVAVADRGAARLAAGHPWVYRSDVLAPPARAGFAPVVDRRGRPLGWAAVHPTSQIAVRWVHAGDAPVDAALLLARLDAALERRAALARDPDAAMDGVTGTRLVHAEADGLPGLVVDRLGPVLVVQSGCAAIEPHLPALVARLVARLAPEGVLGRFDAKARALEGLPTDVAVLHGQVADTVEVHDGLLTWSVDPRAGQKTGAFLDQRLNHRRFASAARTYAGSGFRALDAFAYHGGFGLHLLRAGAATVELVDASAAALAAARTAAARNGLPEPACVRADAFERLRALDRAGARFEAISVDPPALAKRAKDLPRAMAGYKELNLRALRLLAPGGVLGTSSCSAHLQEAEFLNVLADAAADATAQGGRTVHVLGRWGAAPDHPERLGFPESRYLKFVLLRAVD